MTKTRFHGRRRVLTHLVMAYMALAFIWWAILLFRKNDEAFAAKIELAEKTHQGAQPFMDSQRYTQLMEKRDLQRIMILGEASVFILALMGGLYFINRASTREVEVTNQKRNLSLAITHELKSPLASIRLILQSLQRHDLPRNEALDLLSDGLSETDRLNLLVDNVLLTARMDATYQPRPESLDLVEVAQSIIANLKKRYSGRNIRLQSPGSVTGNFDREGMLSIIHNLLENAIKYSPQESTVELIIDRNSDATSLHFVDEGPGIPEAYHERIFDQFFRIGDEMNRETQGTGLGLYLVRRLVAAYEGTISLKANVPKGTVFMVSLPNA